MHRHSKQTLWKHDHWTSYALHPGWGDWPVRHTVDLQPRKAIATQISKFCVGVRHVVALTARVIRCDLMLSCCWISQVRTDIFLQRSLRLVIFTRFNNKHLPSRAVIMLQACKRALLVFPPLSTVRNRKVCRTHCEKFLLITTRSLPQLSEKASTFPVAASSVLKISVWYLSVSLRTEQAL